MHLPQIITIALLALGVGIDLAKDGEPKKGTHSFWVSLVAAVLFAALLWWGKFFSA